MHTSVSTFVIRNPDENHAGVYRWLLRRNLRMPLLAYAVDASGDVWVRGQVPTGAVDAALVDQLLGIVLEAADASFNELLVLGFLTSMKREWAWRGSRGGTRGTPGGCWVRSGGLRLLPLCSGPRGGQRRDSRGTVQ